LSTSRILFIQQLRDKALEWKLGPSKNNAIVGVKLVQGLQKNSRGAAMSNSKGVRLVIVGIAATEHVMSSNIGWSISGGSIGMAFDKIKEEYNFSDFDFSFLVEYTECDRVKTVGVGIEFMMRQKADVVIGPPCPDVILFCMDLPSERRAFMAKMSDSGMTTKEYVYISLSMRSQAFGQTGAGKDILSSGLTAFWEDTENKNADGLNAIAKEASKRVIALDLDASVANQTYLALFKTNVVRRVREDPLFCRTEECLTNDNKARSTYARQLHDTFYMFGKGLSREPTYYHDANNLTKAMAGDFSEVVIAIPGMTRGSHHTPSVQEAFGEGSAALSACWA
ncbi:hypothetical protein TELCIR_16733, partial [Teladorsagia circumcincta]